MVVNQIRYYELKQTKSDINWMVFIRKYYK